MILFFLMNRLYRNKYKVDQTEDKLEGNLVQPK